MTRRILLASLVMICAGCAVMGDPRWDSGYTWTRSNRPALPPVWMALGQDMVRAICRHSMGFVSNACALYEADACLIIAEMPRDQTPLHLVEHEERHCAGEDHDEPVLIPQLTYRR